jgi:nucleoid DNA-binding protein
MDIIYKKGQIKMSKLKKNEINKDTFYRLLASEAGFTISDTKIFWKAVEDIIERAVLSETPLNIGGFGKLYIKYVKEGKGWDQIHKVWYDRKPYKKVVFKLSPTYVNSLKEQDEENI